MKFFIMLAILAASMTSHAGDFSLIDQNGVQHQMSWYARTADASIVLVSYTGNMKLRERVDWLQTSNPQTFYFFVYPGNNRELHSATIPILMDDTKLVSQDLGFYTEGLAAVLDIRTLKVSDKYLIDGYSMVMQNFQREKTSPDYVTDVAPIIIKHCADCHREGGIAPFALNSSQMLRGWSPMIREVLMTKRMPPGQIDPYVGEFTNSMTLTVQETQTLVDWIDAGSPVN
jgi:hypothetical protein